MKKQNTQETEINWREIAINLGFAAAQGACMAAGGLLASKVLTKKQPTPKVTNNDNILSLQKPTAVNG